MNRILEPIARLLALGGSLPQLTHHRIGLYVGMSKGIAPTFSIQSENLPKSSRLQLVILLLSSYPIAF